jgi:hypothetical protein
MDRLQWRLEEIYWLYGSFKTQGQTQSRSIGRHSSCLQRLLIVHSTEVSETPGAESSAGMK